MLNLRYNEMWHEWDGTDESPELCSIPDTNGRMVLSWKRLNVSVRQIKEHFFKSSKITHKQILHNGKYYKLCTRCNFTLTVQIYSSIEVYDI